jgi:hypothetical protein
MSKIVSRNTPIGAHARGAIRDAGLPAHRSRSHPLIILRDLIGRPIAGLTPSVETRA